MEHRPTHAFGKTLYAVREGPLGPGDRYMGTTRWQIAAQWFKRKGGLLEVSHGSLRLEAPSGLLTEDDDVLELVELPQDGRHGGNAVYTWTGTHMVSHQSLKQQIVASQVLQAALDRYPLVPEGYHGWWRF